MAAYLHRVFFFSPLFHSDRDLPLGGRRTLLLHFSYSALRCLLLSTSLSCITHSMEVLFRHFLLQRMALCSLEHLTSALHFSSALHLKQNYSMVTLHSLVCSSSWNLVVSIIPFMCWRRVSFWVLLYGKFIHLSFSSFYSWMAFHGHFSHVFYSSPLREVYIVPVLRHSASRSLGL